MYIYRELYAQYFILTDLVCTHLIWLRVHAFYTNLHICLCFLIFLLLLFSGHDVSLW